MIPEKSTEIGRSKKQTRNLISPFPFELAFHFSTLVSQETAIPPSKGDKSYSYSCFCSCSYLYLCSCFHSCSWFVQTSSSSSSLSHPIPSIGSSLLVRPNPSAMILSSNHLHLHLSLPFPPVSFSILYPPSRNLAISPSSPPKF
jgi:hypothetical protein